MLTDRHNIFSVGLFGIEIVVRCGVEQLLVNSEPPEVWVTGDDCHLLKEHFIFS